MSNIDIVELVAAKLAEVNRERKALVKALAAARREAASPVAESWGEFRPLAEDNSDDMRARVLHTGQCGAVIQVGPVIVAPGIDRADRPAQRSTHRERHRRRDSPPV